MKHVRLLALSVLNQAVMDARKICKVRGLPREKQREKMRKFRPASAIELEYWLTTDNFRAWCDIAGVPRQVTRDRVDGILHGT